MSRQRNTTDEAVQVDWGMAAECLRLMAHPARLALLQRLLAGRFPVGELAAALDLAPNVTSEHLRLMERCGLLSSEREGRQVFYLVAEPHVADLMQCIEGRFAQIKEES